MKRSIFFLLLNTCVISIPMALAQGANEGERVIDEELFNNIKERYNGSWPTDIDAEAGVEILRDGSILMEVDAKMAEFFFYNLNRASEDIQYVPSVRNERYSASWLNYFNRISDNIACGLSSNDLKKDHFPRFKCRFRVDSAGILHSFLDRDETTSVTKPPYYDGQWENGQRDFHWRSVSENKSEASAYSTRRHDSASFDFQVYGELASALYHVLNVEAQDEHWGPFPVRMKVGKQIWCANTSGVAEIPSNDPSGYKCRISFGNDGKAYQDQKPNE